MWPFTKSAKDDAFWGVKTRFTVDAIVSDLDQLTFAPDAKHSYDIMAGAYVWDDEIPMSCRTDSATGQHAAEIEYFLVVQLFLRRHWAYRHSLLIEKPRLEFQAGWDWFRNAAPHWPGFHPERFSEQVKRLIRVGQRKCEREMDRAMKELEAEEDGRKAKPDG